MSPDDDRRALALFDALSEQPPADREAALAELAKSPGLHRRVKAMLATLDAEASCARAAAGATRDGTSGNTRPATSWPATACCCASWAGAACRRYGLAERLDGRVKRPVALKLPLTVNGVLAERFARERDVLVALDAPHIARLYDAGLMRRDRPFIALEYVDGRPITEVVAALPDATPAKPRRCDSRCRCWTRWTTRTASWSCTATSSPAMCWWTRTAR